MESIPCDICGGDAADLEYVVVDYVTMSKHGPFDIVRCSSCGLVYVNPRPTFETIGIFYPSEYYSFHSRRHDRRSLKEILRRAAIASRNRRLFGRLIYLALRGKFKFIEVEGNGRFLDIGCGSGVWLDVNRDYGWDVYGVEINEAAVRQARSLGLKVAHGNIIDAGYPDNYFDLVAMNNVLEHTHSPRATLLEVHRIMNAQGKLHLWVPNYGSYERKAFGRYWRALDVPRHLYHFTSQTLSRLLNGTGFEVAKMSNVMAFEHRASLKWLIQYAPEHPGIVRIVKTILSSYAQRVYCVSLRRARGQLDAPYLYVIASKACK